MVAAAGGVLFAGLALIAITFYRLSRRLWVALMAPKPPASNKLEPPVDEDLDLINFMIRLDPSFERQFPSLAAKVGRGPLANHSLGATTPATPASAPAVAAATASAPRLIGERAQPELSHEGMMPELLSVRADPRVIGGQPSPLLEPQRADPPNVTGAPPAVDPDLAAIVQIWTKLSPRDRRELRRLAEMKRDSA